MWSTKLKYFWLLMLLFFRYNPKIAEKELDVKVYVQVGKQQKLPTNLQLYTCLIPTLDSWLFQLPKRTKYYIRNCQIFINIEPDITYWLQLSCLLQSTMYFYQKDSCMWPQWTFKCTVRTFCIVNYVKAQRQQTVNTRKKNSDRLMILKPFHFIFEEEFMLISFWI